jgi:ribosomal protein S18 acetylase RimI-like enzyme
MSHPLDAPIWNALTTEHARLAVGSSESPLALRYPADVLPMAAIKDETSTALAELRDLLDPPNSTRPGESIYLAAESLPSCPGLDILQPLPCLQMIYPPAVTIPVPPASEPALSIVRLSAHDAPAMVALTDVAFPGFFRPRTYMLGNYYGIRRPAEAVDSATDLIAMAGERLALPGIRELSAVCTHRRHTGQGYAARLITHVLAQHAAAGLETVLHVGVTNHRAIALYRRLGFTDRREITLHHIRRAAH